MTTRWLCASRQRRFWALTLIYSLLLPASASAQNNGATSDDALPAWTAPVAGGTGVAWWIFGGRATGGSRVTPKVGPSQTNPEIAEAIRNAFGEAVHTARAEAGGAGGACETAMVSLNRQLGRAITPGENIIGQGFSQGFYHEWAVATESGHILDPVAQQAVDRGLTTWAELEARGLRAAVEEGIFTPKQWSEFSALGANGVDVAPALSRLGTAIRGAGAVLLIVGAALSIRHIINTPDGERLRVASGEAGGWAGALALGTAFGKLGFAIGGPWGALIGALAGGLIGGLLGNVLGEWLHDQLAGGSSSAASPYCDCARVEFGLLTKEFQEQCRASEATLVKLAAGCGSDLSCVQQKLGLRAGPDGKIVAGSTCDVVAHGPFAWPTDQGPMRPPPRPPDPKPCESVSGIARECR